MEDLPPGFVLDDLPPGFELDPIRPQPPEAGDPTVFKQGPTEQKVGLPQSIAAGFGGGLLMGFGPQIAGASEYTANWGAPGSYERGKAQYEERSGNAQRSNPAAYDTSNVVGGIASALAMPGGGALGARSLELGLRGGGAALRHGAIPTGLLIGEPVSGFVTGALMRGTGRAMTGGANALKRVREVPRAVRRYEREVAKALQKERRALTPEEYVKRYGPDSNAARNAAELKRRLEIDELERRRDVINLTDGAPPPWMQ